MIKHKPEIILKNILVTGGAGFIGSNFIRKTILSSRSNVEKIINLDALTYAGNPSNLADLTADQRYSFVEGDICDQKLFKTILIKNSIDTIVNFAAESHVDRSINSPEPFFQTNVIGTLRILETTKQFWTNLSAAKKTTFRFLHVSTDEVYGSLGITEQPWDENCPYKPNSPYAASKAASDHLVRAYYKTYGLPTITTNCSNNYGPYQFPEKLIPLTILNALEGKPLPIYGDGRQIRDWLYVEDHVTALWLALKKGRLGQTYNIGGQNEWPNIDIVKCICQLLDQRAPRIDGKSYIDQITFVPDRLGHDRRYAIQTSKIRRELGWEPVEDFKTGIVKTVDWYIQNQEWKKQIKLRTSHS